MSDKFTQRSIRILFCVLLATSISNVVVNAFVPRLAHKSSILPDRVDSKCTDESNNNDVTSTNESIHRHASRGRNIWMARRNMNMNRRAPRMKENKPPMNDEITCKEVRVSTPNYERGKDETLGIMSLQEALAKAKELGGLDLILVSPNSDPPVCRIEDYSKYRYTKEKKAKELKKNSKATEIKEVKMSYKIDVHDYEVRKKNALKFLNQGNRVKCSVMFRGREIQHDQLGYDLLDKLAADMEDVCVREGRAKREGRNLSMIVNPRPEVVKRVNADRRAEEKAKRKKKEERQQRKKVAAIEKQAMVATTTAASIEERAGVGVGINGATANYSSKSEDILDLEDDIDNLFGSSDLTDELFS